MQPASPYRSSALCRSLSSLIGPTKNNKPKKIEIVLVDRMEKATSRSTYEFKGSKRVPHQQASRAGHLVHHLYTGARTATSRGGLYQHDAENQ